MRLNLRVALVVGLSLAAVLLDRAPAAAQSARFSAQFASGKRFNGSEIYDWQDDKADPRLDNQKLFFCGRSRAVD